MTCEIVESREEYIERQLSLANKECQTVGCSNRAQIYKTYFQTISMGAFNMDGLDVRVRISICAECDG